MDWSRYYHNALSHIRGFANQRTVILAVMAILLYQATGIGYNILKIQLIRMRPAPAVLQEKAQAAQASSQEPPEAYRVVTERNLFGTTTQMVTDKQAGVVAQDIALLVDLRGTVAGDSRYGFAIIEEKTTRKQRLVKVGDVVSGAKVVRIRRNVLDLLVNDQARTLKMAERGEAPILPAAAAGAPVSAPVTVAGGSIVVDRNEIGAGLQDMGSMLRQAQVRPYFNAGVPEGFMVTNIQVGSLYQRMGIVEGDIIQGVDGRNIRTADDMMALFNTLKGATGMALAIRRGGRQETLNYQFR